MSVNDFVSGLIMGKDNATIASGGASRDRPINLSQSTMDKILEQAAAQRARGFKTEKELQEERDQELAKLTLEKAQFAEREAGYQQEILRLKQIVSGMRGIRDTLRNALIEVAPDHQLINPLMNNPRLVEVYMEVGDRVKRWDEEL